MKRTSSILIAFAAIAILATGVQAKGKPDRGGQGGGKTDATALLACADNLGCAADQIRSDNEDPYNGGIETDAWLARQTNPGRDLVIEFSNCTSPDACVDNPMDGLTIYAHNNAKKVGDFGGFAVSGFGADLESMTLGDTHLGRFGTVFLDPSTDKTWFLRFDPNREGCDRSTNVLIQRISDTEWDVWTPPNGTACLEGAAEKGIVVDGGRYGMQFAARITTTP